MMNRLVFHIGQLKTGTTALQRFLFNNNEILKKQGWILPDIRANIGDIPCYNGLVDGKNGDVLFKEGIVLDTNALNWKKGWEYIRHCLREYNVIVSAEEIWYKAAEFLAAAKKEYDNVDVIFYLRRQDEYVESLWNQSIKSIKTDTFEEKVKETNNHNFNDYFGRIREWEDIIGLNHIICRVYEKEQFKGEQNNIASDFLYSLGIAIDWDSVSDLTICNERLYGSAVMIKHLLNRMHSESGIDIQKNAGYLYTIPKSVDRESYFELSERKEYLKQFDIGNREIAKRYLQRDSGELFFDKSMPSKRNIADLTSTEEVIIRFLYGLIDNIEWRVQKLENYLIWQNKKGVTEILNSIGDRPFAFWGCGYRCKYLLEHFSFPVSVIFDNDKNKVGQSIGGVLVKRYVPTDGEMYFIGITCEETEEIEGQLKSYGYKKGKSYICLGEYLYLD